MKKIIRNELYTKVWSIPMYKVASEYNISDTMLRKICKKLDVPFPKSGYWSKVAFGKIVAKEELKPIKDGKHNSYELRTVLPKIISEYPSDIINLISKEEDPLNKIIVPNKIKSPEKLIREAEDFFSKNRYERFGLLRIGTKNTLDISTTRNSLERALGIMDTIMKELKKRGWNLELKERGEYTKTYCVVLDESIEINLREISKMRKLSTDERKHLSTYDKVVYEPTGRLKLEIKEYDKKNINKIFKDSENEKLENKLNDFLIGLIKFTQEKKIDQIKEDEEKKILIEKQKIRYQKQSIIGKIYKNADDFDKRQKLLIYRDFLERDMSENGLKYSGFENLNLYMELLNTEINNLLLI